MAVATACTVASVMARLTAATTRGTGIPTATVAVITGHRRSSCARSIPDGRGIDRRSMAVHPTSTRAPSAPTGRAGVTAVLAPIVPTVRIGPAKAAGGPAVPAAQMDVPVGPAKAVAVRIVPAGAAGVQAGARAGPMALAGRRERTTRVDPGVPVVGADDRRGAMVRRVPAPAPVFVRHRVRSRSGRPRLLPLRRCNVRRNPRH